jgi:hypothetical protein
MHSESPEKSKYGECEIVAWPRTPSQSSTLAPPSACQRASAESSQLAPGVANVLSPAFVKLPFGAISSAEYGGTQQQDNNFFHEQRPPVW